MQAQRGRNLQPGPKTRPKEERKKNPPNRKRSVYALGNFRQPGPPLSLASLTRFRPRVPDHLLSWRSFGHSVFATGQRHEYVGATARHSQSWSFGAKTFRMRLRHEGRRTRVTTQVLDPSGTFPVQCLPSKPGTSLSLHLNESLEKSKVKLKN